MYRTGYQVLRAPTGGAAYDRLLPVSNYAPWNVDQEFLATYNAIRANTLVDIYRCWELWTLVEDTAPLGGSIIEVGVWRGGTSALIAQKAALCGIQRPIYSCDTFRGVVKAGINDTCYKGGEHADTSCEVVKALNSRLNLTNVRILEGIFPDETAHLIPAEDQTFGLCHIDVDVYQSALEVVDWIWGRLLTGGVIVFDDYGFGVCEGIRRLVDEQKPLRDRRIIHNLNGHALVKKL